MKALLGFFSVLLTTGVSLQYDYCFSVGTSCTSNKVTCPKGQDTCAIMIVDGHYEGEKVIAIYKECSNKTRCERFKDQIGILEHGLGIPGQGIGILMEDIVYRHVECSKAPLFAASLLLALSGLLLMKTFLG